MTSCAHIDRVEELALGLLEEHEAAAVEGHLSACAVCEDARAMFAEERALFERRAAFFEAAANRPTLAWHVAPAVAPPRPESAHSERRRVRFGRLSRSFVASAACAAAISGIVRIETHPIGPIATAVEEATGDGAQSCGRTMSTRSMASFADDVLACASPRGVTRGGSRAPSSAGESLSCGDRRATCQDEGATLASTP